jgi:hypothetical protein
MRGWLSAVCACLALGGCTFDRSGVSVEHDAAPADQQVADAGAHDTGTNERTLDQAPTDQEASDQEATDQKAPDQKVSDQKLSPDHSAPDQLVPCAGLSCPLGCNTAANRCNRLKPTGHSPSGYFDDVTANLNSTTANITVDTDSGEVRAGTTVLRSGGQAGTVINGIYWGSAPTTVGYPLVSVFSVKSLDLPSGRTLTVTGSRAVVFYATGNITIAGTMIAGASDRNPGPGGFAGGLQDGADGASCFGGQGEGGNQAGSGSNQLEAGGGGGGRKASGGDGGDASYGPTSASGGAGGNAVGSSPWPLFGGCGGGAGGGPDTASPQGHGGYGGGGGGAIQLAANGTITISGIITVRGAGGQGGRHGAGGGGGGAGGAVLLEAHSVGISGVVAANGGGGGAGAANLSSNGQDGQDGLSSAANAAGGSGVSTGGSGGKGGALSPEQGANAPTDANAGGGGGAAGVTYINTNTLSQSGTVSPAAVKGTPSVW